MVGHPVSIYGAAGVRPTRGRLVLNMLYAANVRRDFVERDYPSKPDKERSRTFAPTMDVHAGEPVVPDKTPLLAVSNVFLLAVNILLCKSKVDHVYRLVS
jgi:hypothetical protein